MGSESSKSNSNSSKSDSDSSSNSGNKKCILEKMDCRKENDNTKIYRVWIVKKSISLNDGHIHFVIENPIYLPIIISNLIHKKTENIKLVESEKNIFDIKNETKRWFKHWAIILELSNDSYVNIQFGRDGFSLDEFNKTNIEGENILNSIIKTWGEKTHPCSFCYLGKADYEYEKLKEILKKIKDEEKKRYNEKGNIYYNLAHKNCQHFACDIERLIFGEIKGWHSFDYYLDDFFKKFFPNVDINILKSKHQEDIIKKNEEIEKQNKEIILEFKNKKSQEKKVRK